MCIRDRYICHITLLASDDVLDLRYVKQCATEAVPSKKSFEKWTNLSNFKSSRNNLSLFVFFLCVWRNFFFFSHFAQFKRLWAMTSTLKNIQQILHDLATAFFSASSDCFFLSFPPPAFSHVVVVGASLNRICGLCVLITSVRACVRPGCIKAAGSKKYFVSKFWAKTNSHLGDDKSFSFS